MASITVSGGDKWRKALERLAQKVQVRAGVLESAQDQGKSVAQYAAYNEFGAVVPVTKKMRGYFLFKYGVRLKKQTLIIPARPFMRKTLEEHRQEWVNSLASALKAGMSPEDALKGIGDRMVADIKRKIMSNMEPENSPLTVRIKNGKEAGRAGTLFNTGALEKSINFEVQK